MRHDLFMAALLSRVTPGFGPMTLSTPRLPTFLASLVLAGLALASLHVHIPTIGPFVAEHRLWMWIAAYVVLAFGVLFRRL